MPSPNGTPASAQGHSINPTCNITIAAGTDFVLMGLFRISGAVVTSIANFGGVAPVELGTFGDLTLWAVEGPATGATSFDADIDTDVLWSVHIFPMTGVDLGDPVSAFFTATNSELEEITSAVTCDEEDLCVWFASMIDPDDIAPYTGCTLSTDEINIDLGPFSTAMVYAAGVSPSVTGGTTCSESFGDNYLIGIAIHGTAAAGPTITNVDTDDTITSVQTNWDVNGSGFDAATVRIDQGSVQKAQTVNSQDADSINCSIVFDSGTPDLKYGAATLRVTNTDTTFDTIPITIAAPTGRSYVDLGTPNAIADNRITAVADLASGDQLEISNVVGGSIGDVTVNSDATFDCDESVSAFDVRAWDAGDQTWGATGTQTVGSTPAPEGENYVGGTLVDATGVMQTLFLGEGVPVPGTAVYLNGIAHSQFGERYVALWPASGIVSYTSGRALRIDGAQCILESAPTVRLAGLGYSNRGELCVIAGSIGGQYVQGFNVVNGRLAVSNVS